MTQPLLTIGLAAYDDFDGVFFTLQALRMYHDLRQCEIVVVNNSPQATSSAALKKFVEGCNKRGNAGCRYVELAEPVGTAAPRNALLEHATGEWVLVLDSHVLLAAGALRRFIFWLVRNRQSQDLITGPLWSDRLNTIHTHLNDRWRSNFRGIWGTAWESADGRRVSTIKREDGRAEFVELLSGATLTDLPAMPYSEAENWLTANGYRQLGEADDEFEIPGHGLFLFACRRDAWLPFNPHLRGFGGADLYLHRKFQQAGRRSVCLGFLKGMHRFTSPAMQKYRITNANVARNYVLGLQELAAPLDAARAEFVGKGGMPAQVWEKIVADPISAAYDRPPRREPIPTAGPGTELKKLLLQMGIEQKPGCSCRRLMSQMNVWGIAGSREESNRARTLADMRANKDKWGWGSYFKAGIIAIWSGLPLTLEGLYDEAVRLAEINEPHGTPSAEPTQTMAVAA